MYLCRYYNIIICFQSSLNIPSSSMKRFIHNIYFGKAENDNQYAMTLSNQRNHYSMKNIHVFITEPKLS